MTTLDGETSLNGDLIAKMKISTFRRYLSNVEMTYAGPGKGREPASKYVSKTPVVLASETLMITVTVSGSSGLDTIDLGTLLDSAKVRGYGTTSYPITAQ